MTALPMPARSFRFKKSPSSYRRRVARVARASKKRKLKQPWLLRPSSKRLQIVRSRGLLTQRETNVMESALLPNATVVSRLLMHSIVPVATRIVTALALAVALPAREQLRLQLTHLKLLWHHR